MTMDANPTLDIGEDPKDAAPDVLRDMAKWIGANCWEYDSDANAVYMVCRACEEITEIGEELRHSPECEVQILLDLAKAAAGDDEPCEHTPPAKSYVYAPGTNCTACDADVSNMDGEGDYPRAAQRDVDEERCSHGAPTDECAYPHDMGALIPCKGYWGPQYSGGQGEQKRMMQGCPELSRRAGGWPGGGRGYGDDWNKHCPNCDNYGVAPGDTPKEPTLIDDGLAR